MGGLGSGNNHLRKPLLIERYDSAKLGREEKYSPKEVPPRQFNILKSDKVLGTIAAGFDKAKPLFDKGYQLVTLLADGVALPNLAAEQVSRFKKAFPQGL